MDKEIARKKAESETIDAENAKAKASLEKVKAEIERAYAKLEALKSGAEEKKGRQPSYIVSYFEGTRPNWLVRIAFSFWSIPHEIGNFIQAALTGRIPDLTGMSLKNLFYGWEYKGRAPPCIGGTIVNILIGGILLNYFAASPYSTAYNIFNLVFIIIEIAAMAKILKEELSSYEIRFRDPVLMTDTGNGYKVPAGLQWPVVFMKAEEVELYPSERPEFVPEVEPEYVRGFLIDFILSLRYIKLSKDLQANTDNVIKLFDSIRARDRAGWLEPYLMLDGESAILIFKNGPNSTGLGSKPIAYKISLKKSHLPRLETIIHSTYKDAVLQNTFALPSDYLDSFNAQERVALATRSTDHSTHLNFIEELNLASATSSLVREDIKESKDKNDEAVAALLSKASVVFLAVTPLCERCLYVANLHKEHKVLALAYSKLGKEDIIKASAALKSLHAEWKKNAPLIDIFKKRHHGEMAFDIGSIGEYISALVDIMAAEAGLVTAGTGESIDKKNVVELLENAIGRIQSGADKSVPAPCAITASEETFTKKFAFGYDRNIKVNTKGLDMLKQHNIAGSWRALAFSVENAIYGAAKASADTIEPIEIDVKTACRDRRDYVDVIIKDRGRGIKPSDIAKISDPGYTTTGGGTGWAFARRAIQDAGGSVAISSKTSGAGKGTSVTISWPINKITAEPEIAEAAVSKATDIKRTAAPVIKTNVPREEFLRDMNNLDDVGKNMVECILSLSLSKKVVLAFDNKLGGLQARTVLSVFAELEKLKDDEKFKRILKNLQIVILPTEQMASKAKDYRSEGCEVFIFARSTERGKLVSAELVANSTYIDEAQFPLYDSGVYYPLAEIVTVTLAQYLDPRSIEDLGAVLKDMNIKPAVKDGVYIFTLLPPSQRFNPQELMQRYADLKKVLVSA